jgi:serine/threonine-protein kinase
VNLTVAQAPNTVAVPSLVGQTESAAAAALGSAGLSPHVEQASTSEAAQVGIVLRQSPAAGARVRKGSNVTIAVGVLKEKTTPTTTTPTTTTPTTITPPAPGGPTGAGGAKGG